MMEVQERFFIQEIPSISVIMTLRLDLSTIG